MSVISSNQLQYKYSWTAIRPDDPKVTGQPDQTFLNRNEGYEVLAFLNRVAKTTADALKAERIIKTALPGDVRSRANVLDWLNKNWAAYK